MPTRKTSSRKRSTPRSTNLVGTPPELIVVTTPTAELRATPSGLSSVSGASVTSLSSLLKSSGVRLTPVFGNEERVNLAMSSAPPEIREETPNLTTFYKVEADEDKLEKIAEELLNENLVDGAYIKPQMFPPVVVAAPESSPEPAPPVTPDFTARQIYLNAAPAGIDARFAWTVPGGKGQGVGIIDIECAWRFDHEDLAQNQGGVIGGTQSAELFWRNHGTAVIGVIGGDENTIGITGICPQANVRAISVCAMANARAITDAANALNPGDIILIELHAPGPRFNFADRPDRRGFIAIEFWPADFAAIVYATSVRGVIVVEAAGNGFENLDDPLYNTRPSGFPTIWNNPFNLANPQSGAILVGAGAPPPGTHGRSFLGPDRSRLNFSNFGSRVDTQGWGEEVTTTGYGNFQGGADEKLWYTDVFNGTSSASPIIVGALGCAQGARRAAGQALLTPATAKNLLRTTGSPQQDGLNGPSTQRIGNRPNLRQMISQPQPQPQPSITVPLHRYRNSATGDQLYTVNSSELGANSSGWTYDGVHCHVLAQQRTNSVALHRYWNESIGDHFYTTNQAEMVSGRGWIYQRIECFVYTTQVAGTVPLYRYWNQQTDHHFYTTNWAELGSGTSSWRYQGFQCFVFTQPASPPSVEGDSSGMTSIDAGGAASSESSYGGESYNLSTIPSSFLMELTSTQSTSEEGSGQTRRGKAGKNYGQVIININTGGSSDDDA